MSKTKRGGQTYAIDMTAEQIKLLRGLHLRVLMTWTHNSVAVFLENGEVKRIPLWECWFCGYGSYESSDAIPHGKDCIVTLAEREYVAEREYAGLNTQFDEVERSIKPPAERN